MTFGRLGKSLVLGLWLSIGAAAAGPESPTYKPGEVTCRGKSCQAIVMNDDAYGVIVTGKNKRQTRKAAEAKAEELNSNGGSGSFADPCFQRPETCVPQG